jgi:HNH endonuclease
VADRRYSTAAWQRLRREVLARDGYACRIQGPRCQARANTVHHILPSSTHPHLFWDPSNLRAACSRCNYGHGSSVASTNRHAALERVADLEQRNAELEGTVDELEIRCEELALALVTARDGPTDKPPRRRARPAIL